MADFLDDVEGYLKSVAALYGGGSAPPSFIPAPLVASAAENALRGYHDTRTALNQLTSPHDEHHPRTLAAISSSGEMGNDALRTVENNLAAAQAVRGLPPKMQPAALHEIMAAQQARVQAHHAGSHAIAASIHHHGSHDDRPGHAITHTVHHGHHAFVQIHEVTTPAAARVCVFAQNMQGVGYCMGGFGHHGIDCSGMVSACVNRALGLPAFAGRMSTGSEEAWLIARGAVPGMGGPDDLSVGFYGPNGAAGHTACTINGINIESNGSDGVIIGHDARGANDPMFHGHCYHIPADRLPGGIQHTTSV